MNILRVGVSRTRVALYLVLLLAFIVVGSFSFIMTSSAHEVSPIGTWNVTATHTTGPEKGKSEHFIYRFISDGSFIESSGTVGDAGALGTWEASGKDVILDYFAPTNEQSAYTIELQRHLTFHQKSMTGTGRVILIDKNGHATAGGDETIVASRLP